MHKKILSLLVLSFAFFLAQTPMRAQAETVHFNADGTVYLTPNDEAVFNDTHLLEARYSEDLTSVSVRVYSADKSRFYTSTRLFSEAGQTSVIEHGRPFKITVLEISPDAWDPWIRLSVEYTDGEDELALFRESEEYIDQHFAIILRSSVVPCSMSLTYWKEGATLSNTISEQAFTTRHILEMRDLAPNTKYRYTLSCIDENGRSVTYDPELFTTPGEPEWSGAEERPELSVRSREKARLQPKDDALVSRLRGRILLQVEDYGEAWYLHAENEKRYYLGRPDRAFALMRDTGLGISNADLNKIPVGITAYSGADQDKDDLPDAMEEALSTDLSRADSDGDTVSDSKELANDRNPVGEGDLAVDHEFARSLSGKILLQVEGKGEAWYVNPADNRRYYMSRPHDALHLMRLLGLGIGNGDLSRIPLGEWSDLD